jgi:hypothetical protein
METALTILHVACAAVLLAAHALFFFRGLAIEAGRIKPSKPDHLARGLSQAFLPAAALSGLLWRAAVPGPHPLLHLLLGLAPLAAIPLIFFTRMALNKRRQAPWLLPAMNLVLLSAAAITGILFWR